MKSKLEQINKLISEMEDEVPEGERLELELDYFDEWIRDTQVGMNGADLMVRSHTLKAKLVREVEL